MNSSYQYPEMVSQDDQFTPELMPLWHDAMNDLKKRRNLKLLWQLPTFMVFWILVLLIFGPFIIAFAFIAFIGFGILGQAITPTYHYSVSNDRSSAKFLLSYEYRFKKLILGLLREFLNTASQDMRGLLLAVLALLAFPFFGPFIFLYSSLEIFNELWWLKGFENWTKRLEETVAGDDNRQHIRGTHIHPSIQLSGTSPETLPKEPLEVVGGKVTLLPDGGIVIAGGALFDRNSAFVNFSVNGLTLTRETQEMLKVSHDGSIHSFRFDGSSWKEI